MFVYVALTQKSLSLPSYNFNNGDIQNSTIQPTEADCANLCLQTSSCTRYTYGVSGGQIQKCYIKSTGWTMLNNTVFRSGIVVNNTGKT